MQHPFFRSRTKSQVFRELWDVAYTEKIRLQGSLDIETPVKFETIDIPELKDLCLQSNECILIIPKKPKSNDSKEDDCNNNTNLNTVNSNESTSFQAYRLPLMHPTLGYRCIDIRSLFPRTGITTYDPGFASTASCHSAITHTDGAAGRLLHRGYSIEDLCNNCDFVDVSFLLMYGELPGVNDRREHESQITRHTMVHEKLIEVQDFRLFPIFIMDISIVL